MLEIYEEFKSFQAYLESIYSQCKIVASFEYGPIFEHEHEVKIIGAMRENTHQEPTADELKSHQNFHNWDEAIARCCDNASSTLLEVGAGYNKDVTHFRCLFELHPHCNLVQYEFRDTKTIIIKEEIVTAEWLKKHQTESEANLKMLIGNPARYQPTGVDKLEISCTSKEQDSGCSAINIDASSHGGYRFEIPLWKDGNTNLLSRIIQDLKEEHQKNKPQPQSWTTCLHELTFDFTKPSCTYREKYIKQTEFTAYSGCIPIDEFFIIGSVSLDEVLAPGLD